MTPRSIRRASQRKTQKQARKEAAKSSASTTPAYATEEQALAAEMKIVAAEQRARLRAYLQNAAAEEAEKATAAEIAAAPSPTPAPGKICTQSQLTANRQNAQLSTGPTTPEGKSQSSRNALKTGLTGRTVLLPGDDAARYQHHLETWFNSLSPTGDRETELVQSIADSNWRLARIPSLEFGIYALGRIQFANEFPNLPQPEAALLIEAKTFLAYQRQLNNLSIQETRLRRQSEKDAAELNRLQQLRAVAARATRKTALQPLPEPPLPQLNGFEFSTASSAPVTHRPTEDSTLRARPQAA